MHIQHKIAFLTALSLTALSTSARADRIIDSFTDELPLQTLPGMSTPSALLWIGTLSGVTQYQDYTNPTQTGLSGVIGGDRYAYVGRGGSKQLNSLITAGIFDSSLSYATGTGRSGMLVLEYGVTSDLDADLTEGGGVAFELEIDGDMNDGASPRPVQLVVEVVSGSGAAVGQAQATLLDDGIYQIPFSSFSGGVDFTDVDSIKFTFNASAVSSIDYELLGSLRTTSCLQPAGSVVGDIFIDNFLTALPSRLLPGYGMMPFMWVGTFSGTTKYQDPAVQSGIAGAINGQRDTTLEVSDIQNFITASMTDDNATPALSYATAYPTSGHLTLEYGAQGDLNADLSQMTAFELEVRGDMSVGPRPVPLTVTVASGTGSNATQVILLANRTYYIPFSAFPDVDFADVDYIQFYFDASEVQAVDFDLIGGLRASACIP